LASKFEVFLDFIGGAVGTQRRPTGFFSSQGARHLGKDGVGDGFGDLVLLTLQYLLRGVKIEIARDLNLLATNPRPILFTRPVLFEVFVVPLPNTLLLVPLVAVVIRLFTD